MSEKIIVQQMVDIVYVLSVLFRFTDSDYPFAIFKLLSRFSDSKKCFTSDTIIQESERMFLGTSGIFLILTN